MVDEIDFCALLYMESFLERIAPIWQPHAGQREFLNCPAKIRVLACGRRWGKTDACAVSILGELFEPTPTRHLILAPTLDQARILFDRLIQLLDELEPEEACRPTYSPYPRLKFGDHVVTARSGHIGRALRGNEATHVIVDEAAYVPEELVTEVAMPMLATNNGLLTLISTPNGLNHFWRFFKMGQLGEHGVWSRTGPSAESPYVSAEYLDIQRHLISEVAFEVEYEARFVESSGTMFATETIEGCIVAEVHRDSDIGVSVGVDWGRYRDYTAVAVLQGDQKMAQLVELRQFNGRNWDDLVNEAASIIGAYRLDAVCADGTGVGDPVCKTLADLLKSKVSIASLTNANKRELLENLRMSMERRRICFAPEPELIKQLKHFEVSISQAGNKIMNAKHGYHDDLVIALALAYSVLPAAYSAPILVGPERTFSTQPKLCFDDLDWSQLKP